MSEGASPGALIFIFENDTAFRKTSFFPNPKNVFSLVQTTRVSMPEFISKVQYKTCEEGEYFDEKARNPEETIELINGFPWERERYADLSITGPGVVVQDKIGNYLKVGIYYGGKFSLHYLDTNHNYFKKNNITMDSALAAVLDFFSGQFVPKDFGRTSFSFIKSSFETKSFEYRIKFWKVLLFSTFWFLFFGLALFGAIMSNFIKPTEPVGIIPLLATGFFAAVLIKIFKNNYLKRKQALQISRGNDVFLFGNDPEDFKSYNKNDIVKIVHYIGSTGRYQSLFEKFEIIFKDDSSISFSNVLLSDNTLELKFSNKWKFPREEINLNIYERIRSLL